LIFCGLESARRRSPPGTGSVSECSTNGIEESIRGFECNGDFSTVGHRTLLQMLGWIKEWS